ncbi:GntR family transcriptional regulator [Thermaurantiacus tibetensis]|uniref:GntR family transcriptional regulator n=1 Tax=Thermaurantiacus tibetensis TaxID=2759035 RepID=UPI00188F0685|nr:GntR family transcriptional regulator [Thermaurantiacus tibetensis]
MSRAADIAYAEIRGLILSGQAPPGTRLKEEELAARCGVSRTPVRDALRRLEGELYVVRNGSGMQVADWRAEDVEELFALRSMVEAHAAARAATRIDAEALEELRAINARLEAAIARPSADIQAFLEANRAFHARILAAAASPRLPAILSLLVEQPVVRRTAQRYGRDALERSAAEHAELVRALAAHDPEWARAVMTGHIRRAYHAFVDASGSDPARAT